MEPCCLPRVAQYLDGFIPFESLRAFEVRPQDLRHQHVYCSVSPPFPDTPKRIHPSGFWSGGVPRPSYAKLFIGPLQSDPQSSVSLSRKLATWQIEPSIGAIHYPTHVIVEVSSAWAEVLCRLAFKALNPLLFFKSIVESVQAGIDRETKGRMLSWHYCGPFAFFTDLAEATAWCVASYWDGWESSRATVTERLRQLGKYADLNLTEIDFLRLNPSSLAPLLRRGEALIPGLKGAAIAQNRPGLSSVPAIDKMNKIAADLEMFSLGGGGPTSHSPRAFSLATLRTESALKSSGMWWWKELYQQAEPDQLAYFIDNWERNAFFYEFRARLKHQGGMPLWEGFGNPWIGLDHTQRAILYYLWPPLHMGPHLRVRERPRFLPQLVGYKLKVDFARPLDEVLKDVKTKWMSLESRIVHLLGVDAPSASPKTRKRSLSTLRTIPGKWLLLEAMDHTIILGSANHVLSKTDKITYNRQLKEYLAACKEAGIPS